MGIENILEDLFTTVLDWRLSEVNNQDSHGPRLRLLPTVGSPDLARLPNGFRHDPGLRSIRSFKTHLSSLGDWLRLSRNREWAAGIVGRRDRKRLAGWCEFGRWGGSSG